MYIEMKHTHSPTHLTNTNRPANCSARAVPLTRPLTHQPITRAPSPDARNTFVCAPGFLIVEMNDVTFASNGKFRTESTLEGHISKERKEGGGWRSRTARC